MCLLMRRGALGGIIGLSLNGEFVLISVLYTLQDG